MYQTAKQIFISDSMGQLLSEAGEIRNSQIQMVLAGDTSRSKETALLNLYILWRLTGAFLEGLKESKLEVEDINKGALDNSICFGSEGSWVLMGISALAGEETYSEERSKEIWKEFSGKTESSPITTFIWLASIGAANISFLAQNWVINKVTNKTNSEETLMEVMNLLS